MALVDLFDPLLSKLKLLLGPFRKVFDVLSNFWQSVTTLWPKMVALAQLVRSEIMAWKAFKEAIPYRTGVISLPGAVKQTQAILDQIKAGWAGVVDLATQARQAFKDIGFKDPAEEARAALADIEASGFKAILKQFPKLARGLERLLAWLGFIEQFIELAISMTDDFTAIVVATRDIREEVETGSTVFLQQKNPRKTLTVQDGSKIKIRVGSLHK